MNPLPAIAIAAIGAFLLATMPLGLNGDVQYNLGALAVHDAENGLGWVWTFTHRPLVYRAFSAGMLDVVALLDLRPLAREGFEVAVRIAGIAIAVACGSIVTCGLRPRLGAAEALAGGVTIGLALALAPNFDFLQAEWLAAALAATAVGVAVGMRSAGIGAGVAGGLLALAVGAKLSTIVLLPSAIVVIAFLDWRRAALTAGAAAIAGIGLLLVTLSVSTEWQWLLDTVRLNRDTAASSAFTEDPFERAVESFVSKVLVSPLIATLPAAAVLLTVDGGGRRWRPARVVGLALAIGLTLAPPFLQVPSLVYHLAPLAVLAAALFSVAIARSWRTRGRPPLPVLLPFAAYAVCATVLLSQPATWRDTADDTARLATLLGASATAAGALWVVRSSRHQVRRRHTKPLDAVIGLAVPGVLLMGFLPTVVPGAGWALQSLQSGHTNESWAEHVQATSTMIDEVRMDIPSGSSVLYLAYGTSGYHLGNPTPCRYPSPLFLQRAAIHQHVRDLPSYADNLQCLSADVAAALLEPIWLRTTRLPADARQAIAAHFDCTAFERIGDYLLCPARE